MYKNLSFELWPDLSTFTTLGNKSEARGFFLFLLNFYYSLNKVSNQSIAHFIGGIRKGSKFAVVNFHYKFWHIGYLRSEFYYAQKPSFNFQTLVKVVANFANTKAVSGQCD